MIARKFSRNPYKFLHSLSFKFQIQVYNSNEDCRVGLACLWFTCAKQAGKQGSWD